MNRKSFLASMLGALVASWTKPAAASSAGLAFASDDMWIERFLFGGAPPGRLLLGFRRNQPALARPYAGRQFRLRNDVTGETSIVTVSDGGSMRKALREMVAPHTPYYWGAEEEDSLVATGSYLMGAWDVAYNKGLAGG